MNPAPQFTLFFVEGYTLAFHFDSERSFIVIYDQGGVELGRRPVPKGSWSHQLGVALIAAAEDSAPPVAAAGAGVGEGGV